MRYDRKTLFMHKVFLSVVKIIVVNGNATAKCN